MSKEAMKEAMELIVFYEERGADWMPALTLHLAKAAFARSFKPVDGAFMYHKRYQAKVAKQAKGTHETEEESSTVLR